VGGRQLKNQLPREDFPLFLNKAVSGQRSAISKNKKNWKWKIYYIDIIYNYLP